MDTGKNTITPLQAIKLMRELDAAGVPFSIEYFSYNSTKHTSNGVKQVRQATLRQGLRNDQSDKASILIAYTDHSGGSVSRFFYLPLLLKLNNITVKP